MAFKRNGKKMAVILLAGLLLLAAPGASLHAVAQAPAADKTLNDASAAYERAAKAYSDMIAKVNAVKSMPDLDDKEKTIMTAMQQIGDTLKTLLDANKATLDALKELRQAQK